MISACDNVSNDFDNSVNNDSNTSTDTINKNNNENKSAVIYDLDTEEKGMPILYDEINKIFTIENEYVRYSFDINGTVNEFYDKINSKDLSNGGKFALLYKDVYSEAIFPIISLYDEYTLDIRFLRPAVNFILRTAIYDEYIVFKVIDTTAADNVYKFMFGGANIAPDYTKPGYFGGTMLSMNIYTETVGYPGKTTALGAQCFYRTGFKGAQAALIAAPEKRIIPLMQDVLSKIEKGTMTVSKAGGPWANSAEGSNGTYIITGERINYDKIDEYINYFKSLNITQVDFHQGGVFRQGDFKFYFPNGISDFRKFSDKLKENGIMSGLHTYAQFIDPSSKYVTPVPHKDLDAINTYTLAEDITAHTKNVIPVLEDVSQVNTITGFFVRNTAYIQIDDEILKFRGVEPNGFLSVERGALNTAISDHKKGAEIKHLANMFHMFVPKMDSELFLEIARNTADAYNKGGFDMIYLDALDGTASMIDDYNFAWYYSSLFVTEMLKNIEKPPVLEYSCMHPSLWYGRSRMGAADTPLTGYKQFIANHINYNRSAAEAMYFTGQLGWISVYPKSISADMLNNYSTRYMFTDDVDYLGTKALAYNNGLSYLVTSEQEMKRWPALIKNTELIGIYDKLRLEKYFDEKIIEQIKDLESDFKLVNEDGSWYFYKMYYPKVKIFSENDTNFNIYNPAREQKIGIRLENYYSLADAYDSDKAIILLETDENAVIPPDGLKADISEIKNCPKGLGVWIYGNNEGSYVSIKMNSLPHVTHSFLERLIKVDFTGWKYFELVETDNGEIPEARAGRSADYAEFREFPLDLNSLTTISVTVIGENNGIRIRSIKAINEKVNTIKDPELKINGKTIKFGVSINSGEYLEYTAGEKYVNVYDSFGNIAASAEFNGDMVLKTGNNDFSFNAFSGSGLLNRVRITAIIIGEKIQ